MANRKLIVALLGVSLAIGVSCRKKKSAAEQQTLTSGHITLLTDNTVQPIIEDAIAVFQGIYPRAHVKQVNKPENEIVAALLKDSAAIVVLPRKLTKEEEAHFLNKKIVPRVTHFATDAVALITNEKAADTVINLEEVIKVLRGQPSSKVSKLVFDNPNSSTVQYLLQVAGVKDIPVSNIFALQSNEEVIRYVNENNGAVGIIGVNWLLQPPAKLLPIVENVRVLGVDNVKKDGAVKKYYKPNQTNIATGNYPLTRGLYVLNYSGGQGLGMGFAIYITAREGQRLILKSGLLPVEIPPREISVRDRL